MVWITSIPKIHMLRAVVQLGGVRIFSRWSLVKEVGSLGLLKRDIETSVSLSLPSLSLSLPLSLPLSLSLSLS
jgi:hypothetical protein